MAKKKQLPWLDYAGQDTAAILSFKTSHRIDSLFCALEQAIQLRQSRLPDVTTTPEEYSFLAIMALQREVNNGGYDQFFLNSSRQYAPTVVAALRSVGWDATAALTQRAVDASMLDPGSERDAALDALDKQFYTIVEIETNLFSFIESHQPAFAIPKIFVPPPPPKRGNINLIKLGVGLDFAPKPDRTFAAVRKLAAEVAIKNEIQPSDSELDGAAYVFLFKSCLKAEELEQCEEFEGPAFDLAREDTSHCILQREWVLKLIEQANFTRADEVTLQYLQYLHGDDTSILFIKNRIKFWADPIRKHGDQLPRSSEFFRANFPDVSLLVSHAPIIYRLKDKPEPK
jgi:hypothetical protein